MLERYSGRRQVIQEMMLLKRNVGRVIRSSTRCVRAYSSQELPVPDLNGLEKRWPKMKELDQADVIDYLNWRAEDDWKYLTTQEKKSLYYIYFGNWGPRSPTPPQSVSGTVLKGLFGGVLTIALGVGVMNYAYDLEREEKVKNLLERIEKEK